ncbi:hypothetical protein [Glaciimonas immobilis]|uniref:Uncharacterized protein n=1 Tax=Glaciimonas immobilis TaxID=728004 RepID=A0A840RPS7_9BURK|nr:hypothetical protein [Glaciimonas immobilis]KAF3999268.1 hypothetical protein HAV38_04850 [Glaciimonas immobilis]MBB5198734.1 hypothetical protein [Glaciimonas immobilis]
MIVLKLSLFAEEELGNRRERLSHPLIELRKHVDFVAQSAVTYVCRLVPRLPKVGGRYWKTLMTRVNTSCLMNTNRRSSLTF